MPPRAGQSYAQPFELLNACHERVERSLALLQRLIAHLQQRGAVDAAARDAARDVLRYFDIAAPLHHQDEERHVFPALAGDARLAAVCARLQAQHLEIGAAWQRLRPLLEALTLAELPALQAAAAAFVELHDEHLRSEHELVFPAAAARLDPAALRVMGLEMAARRGLDLTGSAGPGSR